MGAMLAQERGSGQLAFLFRLAPSFVFRIIVAFLMFLSRIQRDENFRVSARCCRNALHHFQKHGGKRKSSMVSWMVIVTMTMSLSR